VVAHFPVQVVVVDVALYVGLQGVLMCFQVTLSQIHPTVLLVKLLFLFPYLSLLAHEAGLGNALRDQVLSLRKVLRESERPRYAKDNLISTSSTALGTLIATALAISFSISAVGTTS